MARNRYKEMERYMTYALAGDGALFIFYLIAAGNGIIWLKAILAVLAILLSGLCLAWLYMSRELLRPRSLWMSVSAAAVITCILASLLLNYPSAKVELVTGDPAAQTAAYISDIRL